MEVSTPDKPEVLALTAKMGWDDPDLTVGKLFRVWRWFDQQTTDGNAPGVTKALLDRIAGVTGFAEAMQFVGWLVVTDDGASLPNFGKHCGKTAKERAQTAKRVAAHKSNGRGNGRGNGGGNATTVTEALPREDKREEEEKHTQTLASEGLSESVPKHSRVHGTNQRALGTNPRATGTNPRALCAGFEQFWSAYPRRRNRGQAEKAWARLKPDAELLERILQAVEVAKRRDDWRKDDGRFVPYPATWLNAKGWEDDQAEPGAEGGHWWLARGFGSERSAIEAGEKVAA